MVVKGVNTASRVITFAASMETPDRDGDIVRTSGWDFENYIKNPVFLWAHNYDEPPVGKGVVHNGKDIVYTEGTRVMVNIQFPIAAIYPFGDTVFRLYAEGYLSGVSVAFIPREWEDLPGGGKEFTGQELVEISAVPVPSHPGALAVARGLGIIPKKFCPVFCNQIREGLELCC